MKFWSFLVSLAISLVCYSSPSNASTCVGANPCHACHTCEYCKRCSKQGGSCGVCKGANSKLSHSHKSVRHKVVR